MAKFFKALKSEKTAIFFSRKYPTLDKLTEIIERKPGTVINIAKNLTEESKDLLRTNFYDGKLMQYLNDLKTAYRREGNGKCLSAVNSLLQIFKPEAHNARHVI